MKKSNLFGLVIALFIALVGIGVGLLFVLQNIRFNLIEEAEEGTDLEKHIVVLGTYENQLFLKQVCDGARNVCSDYNATVEFYVPQSLAQDQTVDKLFNYASFVNADGVIAYLQSGSENVKGIVNIEGKEIPIVTTGTFDPNSQQVSYIGTSYWELGRVIAEEINSLLKEKGQVYILCRDISSNPNFSNLTTSIQVNLARHGGIKYKNVTSLEKQDINEFLLHPETEYIAVCLTEDDTMNFAQYINEFHLGNIKNLRVLGVGSNELSQSYLSKGIVDELISIDPEKIGETAIREIFEYINHGYANSYIAADIKIERGSK